MMADIPSDIWRAVEEMTVAGETDPGMIRIQQMIALGMVAERRRCRDIVAEKRGVYIRRNGAVAGAHRGVVWVCDDLIKSIEEGAE